MAALRAVKPGEDAPPARAKSVSEAAKSGTERELLVAMRDRIALTVQDEKCPPRDLASLTRRLQDVVRAIADLDSRAKQEAEESGPVADEAWDAEAL